MNYSELQTNIASWLNRQDLSAVIPTFISLAEADFNRSLRTRDMLCRATATLDTQFTALPSDFLEAKNVQLNVNPVRPLEYVTLEYADFLRSGNFITAGKPLYFTIHNGALETVPIPDSDYEIEFTYYKKITPLSDSNTSNWLLSSHPDIYLYGSLMQSAPYLKDDERMGVWGSLYRQMIADANNASDNAEASGGVMKMRTKPWA